MIGYEQYSISAGFCAVHFLIPCGPKQELDGEKEVVQVNFQRGQGVIFLSTHPGNFAILTIHFLLKKLYGYHIFFYVNFEMLLVD